MTVKEFLARFAGDESAAQEAMRHQCVESADERGIVSSGQEPVDPLSGFLNMYVLLGAVDALGQ